MKPRLHVMDAVVAMEGNGPGAGTPTQMGLLMLTADPVAGDTVFCRLIDIDPETVPTNVQGRDTGIGTDREEEIGLLLVDPAGDGAPVPIGMRELCERCIYLENGKIAYDGDPETAIALYQEGRKA